MDSTSMNHYEKQLYSVFKTFDVNNEEALNRSAVHELCDALQLEDRGETLVDTLFERRSDRVTFAQFRNGLLAVLGGDAPASASAAASLPQPHSDDDSSGREVAPKFVFGSKKYGRRSRPQHGNATTAGQPSPRASSASRLDTDDRRARQRTRCRRSASAMESREDEPDAAPPPAFEHDRRIDRDQALALCRGLRMDGIDRQLVERIFEDSPNADTTVGEFFDRLNASLTDSIEQERDRTVVEDAPVEDAASDDEAGVLSSLVDAWEGAGVQRPRRLLAELGFTGAALRLADVQRALDEELRALPEPPAARTLPAAALALCRLRLQRARLRADRAVAERDKLRADVAEANRRAGLLAQEVDESHARIELELKTSVRRAESRYSEAVRLAEAEAAAERERAAAERSRLEEELARRSEAEARLRSEADSLRSRVEALESCLLAAEESADAAERECARAAAEARAAEQRGAAAAEGSAGGALQELAQRLDQLRDENKMLRDRNDELCAELEASARRAANVVECAAREHGMAGGDLSAELGSLLLPSRIEDCDSAPVSLDLKTSEYLEDGSRVIESGENVSEQEAGSDSCAVCGARLPVRPAGSPPDGPASHEELQDLRKTHEEEKKRLTELVKDLESSLEQMRVEFDKCEEYWRAKLESERQLFAEEQRLGDERLAELAGSIREYERQFAAGRALPAIDEKRSLEAQFTELDEEFAAYRRRRDAELAERDAELRRLQERLAALERPDDARRAVRDYHNPLYAPPDAPPAAPPPAQPVQPAQHAQHATGAAGGAGAGGEVRELRARLARAEAAVRRLHARLAAADLLVKDLYVENCQLAHRRPL